MKRNQFGGAGLVALIVLGILFGIGFLLFGVVNSNNSEAVGYETQIEALHKDSENVLAQFSLKVVEASGVATAHKKDIVELANAAMQGRYGEDGSKAVFQMIKENNPTIDPSLRIKVQQIIDGGRTNFESAQRVKLDVCRAYKNSMGQLVGGAVKRFMGFPKIDMKDLCEIVSSSYANKAFETKIEEGIKGLDQ